MMLSDFIYGGIDGVITTAAIIAGILGANISSKYALILGVSNLCADGFSMGIARYNSLVNISENKVNPLQASIVTFLSFVFMGSISLIPFLFINIKDEEKMKKYLLFFCFISFFVIGLIKGYFTKKTVESVLQVVCIGTIGVFISFYVSKNIKELLNK